jgi:hypothetical protein
VHRRHGGGGGVVATRIFSAGGAGHPEPEGGLQRPQHDSQVHQHQEQQDHLQRHLQRTLPSQVPHPVPKLQDILLYVRIGVFHFVHLNN